ncbi:hypothetical protein PHYPSEUDO_006774 [Phytophthora pseudosyringae]|uniref:Uncharacterized protein n=1 Tax=Phytophthora pseudosyringae TaxID=221518 RepID=A0A8T1VL20_9STRA|nr:hypothetical protein PHYPSEUDO_006774 [Phytophthora pseudosyringae]
MDSRVQGEEGELKAEYSDALSAASGSEASEVGPSQGQVPGNPPPVKTMPSGPPAGTGACAAETPSAPLTDPLRPDLTTPEGMNTVTALLQRAVANP